MPAAINMECQKERLHNKLKLPHRLYFIIVEKANFPLFIPIKYQQSNHYFNFHSFTLCGHIKGVPGIHTYI